jgi:hypothetical protein
MAMHGSWTRPVMVALVLGAVVGAAARGGRGERIGWGTGEGGRSNTRIIQLCDSR